MRKSAHDPSDAAVTIGHCMECHAAWDKGVSDYNLRAYDTASEARASIGRYLDFYNRHRPHSSLDGTTPDQAYFNSLPLREAA